MEKRITIVQMNDTHGYLETHNEIFYEGKQPTFKKAGGYARIQTLLKEMRKEGPVIVLDNGDTIHGTYEAVESKGWNMVPILNEMGFSAMTFHWDIGYGPENLKQIGKALNYPILAINAYEENTMSLFLIRIVLWKLMGYRLVLLVLRIQVSIKQCLKASAKVFILL